MQSPLLVEPVPGFSPQIGLLVSMMNLVRFTTLEAVKGLTVEQLDFLLDDRANSLNHRQTALSELRSSDELTMPES